MFTPASTRPAADIADLFAEQAATLAKVADLNQRLTRLVAEVTELNGQVVDIQRRLDGTDPK